MSGSGRGCAGTGSLSSLEGVISRVVEGGFLFWRLAADPACPLEFGSEQVGQTAGKVEVAGVWGVVGVLEDLLAARVGGASL